MFLRLLARMVADTVLEDVKSRERGGWLPGHRLAACFLARRCSLDTTILDHGVSHSLRPRRCAETISCCASMISRSQETYVGTYLCLD